MRNDGVKNLISEFVVLMLEQRKIREIETSNGTIVPEGSAAHISDLQEKIEMLERMKKRQPRGSSARADHARVVQRLKSELRQARNISQRLDEKETTLREYVRRALIKEEEDNPAVLNPGSDIGMGSMGDGLGAGSMSAILGLDGIINAGKTAIGKTKELSRKVATGVQVAFGIAVTTIIPWAETNYSEIFDKEKKDIAKIRAQYKGVYDAVDKAFDGEDFAFLAFCASPGLAMTAKAASLAPGAAKVLLGAVTGGLSDEFLDVANEKAKTHGSNLRAFFLGEKESTGRRRKAARAAEERKADEKYGRSEHREETSKEKRDRLAREFAIANREHEAAEEEDNKKSTGSSPPSASQKKESLEFFNRLILEDAKAKERELAKKKKHGDNDDDDDDQKDEFSDPEFMKAFLQKFFEEHPEAEEKIHALEEASKEAYTSYLTSVDKLAEQLKKAKTIEEILKMSNKPAPKELKDEIEKLKTAPPAEKKKAEDLLTEKLRGAMKQLMTNDINKKIADAKKADPSGGSQFVKDHISMLNKIKTL